MSFFDCSDQTQLLSGLRAARNALAKGELVVFPTDTVYGIAADAFSPAAVERLLAAKGRGRTAPPPVLIPTVASLHALSAIVPDGVIALAREFWPGALTIILPAQPSLSWDLGETGGTVALRIPDDPIALELLTDTGPLAVSSANLSGETPARTASEARDMLGDSVSVYLDNPAADAAVLSGSTILDATAYAAGVGPLTIVRQGPVTENDLARVVGAEAFQPVPDEPTTANGTPE